MVGGHTVNAVKRTPPPPLEYPCPPCSICGEATDYEDGSFYCSDCGASWNADMGHQDGYSRWDDPGLPQCPATVRPYKGDGRYPFLSKVTYRCLLSTNHDNQHRGTDGRSDEVHEWDSADRDGYLAEILRDVDRLALLPSALTKALAEDIRVTARAAASDLLGIPPS